MRTKLEVGKIHHIYRFELPNKKSISIIAELQIHAERKLLEVLGIKAWETPVLRVIVLDLPEKCILAD